MNLQKKIKALRVQFPFLLKATGLIWRVAPGWSLLWVLLLVIQGLLPVFIVFLTRSVVNGLVETLNNSGGWEKVQPLLVPIGMMVSVLLLMVIIRSLLNIIRTAQSLLVEEKIHSLVQNKSIALDLSSYESSEYYDKLFRARNDAMHRPLELVESLGSLLKNGITLSAMSVVLFQYSLWAPIALLVSTLPVLYVVLDHRFRHYQWRQKNTQLERKAFYYDWLVTSRESAAEVRLFAVGDHFKESFQMIKEKLRNETLQLDRSKAIAEFLSALFALLVTGGAMGWMVWRVVSGTVTLGDMALFYQAFNQGQQLLRSLLENVGHMYGSSLFLSDFFDFLNIEPQITSPVHPVALPRSLDKGVKFEHVRFSYPFVEKGILDDFNLDIEAGKVTAIVGMNGAGKSTLVKLLCRLYDPESGKITIDGVDLKEAHLDDVRKMVTVLFQEPVRYNMSVADNIRLGNLSVTDHGTEIMDAAVEAGAEPIITGLKNGFDTQLGRWFSDSTDLSGGEWQRLALARAFLRKSPVIILDEPTSSMDSWSEIDWLERFKLLASGRTSIIITHRFTTAMQADIIHVMDKGKIIESGSHAELIDLGGRYAQSWQEQVRNKL